MILTDHTEDALDPGKIPTETVREYRWINKTGIEIPPGPKYENEYVADFLKSVCAESEIEKVIDTLAADSGVRPSLDQFMWATANPHEIDPETDPSETAMSSVKTAVHLAAAKAAMLNGAHAKAHKHLDKALQNFTPVHGAVCARVAQPTQTDLSQ
jgi:hypothetical protein